jgi:hypothetical protein
MTVRIEKDGPVWTVTHSRPEARNAMDPKVRPHSTRRSACLTRTIPPTLQCFGAKAVLFVPGGI